MNKLDFLIPITFFTLIYLYWLYYSKSIEKYWATLQAHFNGHIDCLFDSFEFEWHQVKVKIIRPHFTGRAMYYEAFLNVHVKSIVNPGFPLIIKSATEKGFKALEAIKRFKNIHEVEISGKKYLVGSHEDFILNQLYGDQKFLSAIPKLIMKDTSFMSITSESHITLKGIRRVHTAYYEGFQKGIFEDIPTVEKWVDGFTAVIECRDTLGRG